MNRSKDKYDMIKKNIIFEDKIYYKKDGKQYIGCLVKSKYADQSDQIEFYLFENKTTQSPFICLDLIEYEKVEKCIEQKKDIGWKSLGGQKILFYFELIPKHQQQKEIFACETEDNRIKWLKILNESIENLKTNNSYDRNSDLKRIYAENSSEEIDHINERLGPIIPSRNHQKIDSHVHQLNYILFNPIEISLNENDIFYQGTFEELHKILREINQPGVYAVSQKIKPESDCTLAIRVYKNEHTPILSWNIYQNKKMKEYYLLENDRKFFNIVELCLYYTKNDLPTESNIINRLTLPYKYYLN